jgi:hypothetical protein
MSRYCKICILYYALSQKPQGALNLSALLRTLLHATVHVFLHNLLKVLVQIANKMGLQKTVCTSVLHTSYF